MGDLRVGKMAPGFRVVVVGATVLLASATAQAQQPAPVVPAAVVPSFQVPADVAAAYSTYHIGRIWFRNGPDDPAVAQLTAILQRAPFDGFAEGPQLAAQVQTAVAQVRANPGASAAAE